MTENHTFPWMLSTASVHSYTENTSTLCAVLWSHSTVELEISRSHCREEVVDLELEVVALSDTSWISGNSIPVPQTDPALALHVKNA